jgi:hypothetical protein
MEGLVFTLVVVALMVVAIVVLGRSWPRSSRIGGYRAKRDGGAPAASGEPPVREDDDAGWNWAAGGSHQDDGDHDDRAT